MNKIIIFSIVLLTVMFNNNGYAGQIDLEIELTIADTNNLTYGQVIPFSVTVTNHGPDDTFYSDVNLQPNSILIRNIIENSNGRYDIDINRDTSFEQDCLFIVIIAEPLPPPFPPPTSAYLIATPFIPASTSITCYGVIRIFMEQNVKTVPFEAFVHQLDTDSNLNNNIQNVTFRLKPPTIPATSWYTLLFLVGLILFIAFKKVKIFNKGD